MTSSFPDNPAQPLSGVRVLCMAGQYPGPYATLLLADLGADVVMVERPQGDPTRAFAPFFESLNRHKRSITIDMSREEDRARLLALVERCDVFIEGARPGVAARLGVDADTLRARHPDLVYVSISAFGQDGPYRDRAAHDLSLQALAGLLHGRETLGATHPYVPWGDVLSGLFAAFGIAASLLQRERGGPAATLDVAMSDCLASAMTSVLGPLANGASPFIIAQPGYGNFRCADGEWINVSVTHEEHLWRNLADALGLGDLRHLDATARARDAEALRDRLAARFAQQPRAHWEAALAACDTAWAPVLSPAEVVQDAHLNARCLFPKTVDGRLAVRQPLRFSGGEVAPLAAAPALGADNGRIAWSNR